MRRTTGRRSAGLGAWRSAAGIGLLFALATTPLARPAGSQTSSSGLTPEEIARASAAALTTRDFSGRREYYAVPVDPNATTQRRELTQAEVDAQKEARAQTARLESQLSQREALLPGAVQDEKTAVDNLVKYYQDHSQSQVLSRIDYVLDLVGTETEEEAGLKRAAQAARHHVDSLRTQIRDTRTELETVRATNTEVRDQVATLQGQRLAAQQESTAQLNTLINRLNTQQNQLASAQQTKKDAQAEVDRIDKETDFINDIYDFTVGIFGRTTPSGAANTALENATVRERSLQTQVNQTKAAIETAKQNAIDQDHNYEIAIIKSSPRLLAEDRARRSNEAIDLLRNVETQRAQIQAGETQFNSQLATLDAQIAAERAKAPATGQSQGSSGTIEDSQAVKDLLAERKKVTDAHTAWRASMDAELQRHQTQQEQFFEQNRRDGIGETNSGETRTTIRQTITRINERGDLSETQKGEMIADISSIDAAAESAAGLSALAVAKGAPSMAEFENTWSSFWSDVKSTNSDLTWYEFSLRMGAYTTGVTRAGIDAVKDLMTLAKEGLDTQGEAFEAFLEKTWGIKSDFFGSENLALLERIKNGYAKLLDANDPEGAKLAQDLVRLGEEIARKLERRVETMASSTSDKNVRKALEDFGYVVGTVTGVEEVAYHVAAAAPKAVRGIVLWTDVATDAAKAIPPGGALPTELAGAATDASRAATDASRAATDTGKAVKYGDAVPTDGTPWGTHLEVDVFQHPLGGDTLLTRSDGTQLRLTGKPLGKGSTTEVYEVAGRSDIVVRLTKADPAGAALDNAGHRALTAIDPEGSVFEVPKRYSQHPIHAEGSPLDGGIVEVVERAPTDWRKALEAGEVLTDGKKEAYRRAMEKINENGFVMLDNKADNYAFKKIGEPDEWKLVILDPGSVVPMKNLDANAARRLQHALDNPIDEAVEAGRAWEKPVDPRQMTGRQIHTEWLAKNFDHLIDWDAINKLHPDFDFHTLGEGYRATDLLLNKRFPMNPMNGVENPGISGPLKAPDAPSAGPSRTPTGGEAAAETPKSLWQTVKEKSPDYTGTKRNPVRLGDEGTGGGGGSSVAVTAGGFSGIPVVDPIHFFMGPGLLTGGVSTDCPPCIHYVIEYNQLYASGVRTPGVQARMEGLLDALETCEWFYCGGGDEEIGSFVELIQVIGILGNNPYNAVDPTASDSSSSGNSPIIGGVQVIVRPGNVLIPIDQFSGTSDPDACPKKHYHDARAITLPVLDCNGNSLSDPDPLNCGYGTTDAVITVPKSQCPIRDN